MKYLLLAAALIGLAHTTSAQEPVRLNFKLSPSQLGIIARGLETQPYNQAAPLLADLQNQYKEATKPPPVPPANPSSAPTVPGASAVPKKGISK